MSHDVTDLSRRLADEVAVITGGCQGIGLASAERLAAEGAAVAVIDLNDGQARAAARELVARGRKAIGIGCDVSKRHQVREAIAQVVEEFGRLTILVNNAGIIRVAPFAEITDEVWAQVLDVNLNGMFIVAQEATRQMRAQGFGRVVNMSSVSAHIAHSGQAAYAVTKAGIEAMTRAMAVELAPFGISVNAIAPGPITTSFAGGSLSAAAEEDRIRRIPLRRFGQPAEVAGVVALLPVTPRTSLVPSFSLMVGSVGRASAAESRSLSLRGPFNRRRAVLQGMSGPETRRGAHRGTRRGD